MTKMQSAKISAKEKIILTAMRLFNRQGVHHTGNEQIISESGISKMTFYNHFPTKSKLIAEYLRRRDKRWFELLNQHLALHKSAEEKLLSLFDALEVWFKEPDFYGCPFIRGLSDFDSTDDKEVVDCVSSHFNETGALILNLLKELKLKNPENLVPTLLTLIAGSIVVAHATRSPESALVNRETAKVLIQNAIGEV